ncbi:MAG: arylesterase [Opitutaceae bacterium]|nr:arylesterase [Opitutaceae bacterium]
MSWLLSLFILCGAAAAEPTRVVLLVGDSLTAGYGVDPDEAYPALLQRKIDEARLPWRVVNAGVSGDTTAGGLRRMDWLLRQSVDLVVVGLGGNDGLRGIPPATTEKNLLGIIEKVRARSPNAHIVVAGMQMPPNMGPEFRSEFAAVFPRVASATQATLIPFLLEGVGGDPALNLPDGIHPTPAGHVRIAETVWQYLHPLLSPAPVKRGLPSEVR